jgi:hypothetical protein
MRAENPSSIFHARIIVTDTVKDQPSRFAAKFKVDNQVSIGPQPQPLNNQATQAQLSFSQNSISLEHIETRLALLLHQQLPRIASSMSTT